ncbi:MAG: ATP-binding protein [Verrucomicrobiales bacterium]|jgi:predicted AAA+ superfamily ATPase|nr:ATP-binding protein [Verrucomicrobiales bacterium]
MIRRFSREKLEILLGQFPAVALLGPRQCGKTTLALEFIAGRDAVYLDLETPSDLRKLGDAEDFFARHANELVVLDEIQRQPDLFPVLRGVIDRNKRRGRQAGQFLLLGSASLDLLRQSSESLAGRLATLELTPLLADETRAAGLPVEPLWVRGGFPESYLADDDAASLRWRLEFIRTYLERDIPALGPRLPAETLRRLWTMLAHAQGALFNAAALAGALGVSGQTVARYVDLLADLLLVRRLPPWSGNTRKRLVRSPKVYVRDSGVAHALLGLATADDILGHPVAGASWEGWVIENLLAALPDGAAAAFYRTGAGAEVDLVLALRRGERWAVEIKRSAAPVVGKGFYLGCADLKVSRKFVVYPGRDSYSLGDGVEAVSLSAAVDELRARSR